MATREREKAIRREQNRDKRPTAVANYIRIPSSKVKIVLDVIRGRSYNEAVAILNNTNKSASPIILKVLNSAAANAENNLNMVKDNLYVAECWAMNAPMLKRMMPRARGRADRILKYSSHIRIILDERGDKKMANKVSEATTKAKTTPAKPAAKQTPKTMAERPLTDKPNTKVATGVKKDAVAAKPAATSAPKATPVKAAAPKAPATTAATKIAAPKTTKEVKA